MTVHPRSLPSRAFASQPGSAPADVPGLAYYSENVPVTVPTKPPARLSPEAQALDLLFGYYTPQE